MTVSFPITLPSLPNFVAWDIQIEHATGRSESPFTFFENTQEHMGAKLLARATLPRMNRADAAEWFGTLASLRGGVGTFLMGDPDAATPLGTGSGVPEVNGGSQTGILLVTDGWAFSETVLKRGDWFQLGSGGSAHMHLVTQDVTSDGAGNATIDMVPRLRASPANNDPLTVLSPQGQWRLVGNTAARTSDLAKFGVGLICREAL